MIYYRYIIKLYSVNKNLANNTSLPPSLLCLPLRPLRLCVFARFFANNGAPQAQASGL
jgi:hypothetical protein